VSEPFDLVVVGGGPGGAALATIVAMTGGRVLLLERERFPRYQIGESLMVSTVQGICRTLGVWDEVHSAGFVKKPGGVFRWGHGPDLWTLSFTQARQLDAVGGNYAFHVERSVFDQILLENARRKGVRVCTGNTVERVARKGDGVSVVVYRDEFDTIRTVHAQFVADASGHGSRFHRLVGRRVFSQFFRNIAVFCYFEGADRLPAPLEGGGITEAFADGWVWFLPLSSTLTSVGAVVGADRTRQLQSDRERTMLDALRQCPHVHGLLTRATRVTEGPYGQVRIRTDFSYTNERFWRPGLVLVGDAACFIDPLFTTGVHLATYSALLAARSINSVLLDGVDEETAFNEFEYRYRLEFELFYNFALAFYDMHVEGDAEHGFWASRKVARTPEIHNDEFVRLLTNGSDAARDYFKAKRGIGEAAQQYVLQLKKARSAQEHIAISRAMAEHIHGTYRPPSGPRPFHMGFEDIRTMSWGRASAENRGDAMHATTRPLVPSDCGLRWRAA